MAEDPKILTFKVYIEGPSLFSMESRMSYPEIIQSSIFSPGGYAPVLDYKVDLFNDKHIDYTVSVDAEKFKSPLEFSRAMRDGIKVVIKDRKVQDSGTFDDNGSESVLILLEYSSGLSELGDIAIKAKAINDKARLTKEKEELEEELEEAKRKGYEWRAENIQDRLREIKDELEAIQKIELSSSYSASESELMNKALESEVPKEEEKEERQQIIPQPVPPQISTIIPPAPEKNVMSISKETSTKESSLIQSVLNNITSRELATKTESSSVDRDRESSKVLESQIIKTIVSSVPGLLQKELEKQASSIVSSVSNAENTVSNIVSSVVPSGGLSGLVSTLMNTESNNTVQTNDANSQSSFISSINDSIRLLQNSIERISTDIASKTSDIASMLSVSSDSDNRITSSDSSKTTSLSDTTVSSDASKESVLESIGSKLFQTVERSGLFSSIQEKVVDVESSVQNIPSIPEMVAGIGDSIKSAVTSISAMNKTTAEVSTPTMKITNTTNESSISEGDTTDSMLGNQNVQNLMGGPVTMPSVVSLSQNTIDNLASAIIKNMSIAPFLNSGR